MTEMYRSSLPQNGGDGEWISIMPNQICYSKAIHAWSNSDARDAVDRASRIFESMHGNRDGDGDSDMSSDTIRKAPTRYSAFNLDPNTYQYNL